MQIFPLGTEAEDKAQSVPPPSYDKRYILKLRIMNTYN